jgi:HEAT repeat protein
MYVAPPVVVEAPCIITQRRVVVEPKRYEYRPAYSPANAKLFAEVRDRKSELLRTLKIGDKASRTKAVAELAGYSFDINVSKALEEIILEDPDPELRKRVAESLGNVKNKDVIPTLEKVRVEDSNEEVRREADRAIEKIKAY